MPTSYVDERAAGTPTVDERTALLRESQTPQPVPPRRASPYNLLSVRALRWISIGLLAVASVWWIVLLISTFITIPGLHATGGGWWAFGFSTLSLFLLLTLLLFYRTPSKTERLLNSLTLLFTVTSLLLISIPGPVRHAERYTGIVSAAFCTFCVLWCIICDRTVDYAVHYEEHRLFGRRRPRRWSQFFSVFSGSLIGAVMLAISILFTIHLSIFARDATLPAPGRLLPVENGAYHVHLFCRGNTTDASGNRVKTVLLESGHEPAELRLESWVRESFERENSPIPRYCYWDRPGYGFSGTAPSPVSAGKVADALSEALVAAGEDTGRYVLVAHGVGGIYARIFAARHAADVAGIMLIDALPESLLYRVGGASRGFWFWLRGVLSPLGIDRIWATWFLGRGREDRIYGRDAYMRGSEIKAKLQESLTATSFTKNEIIAAAAILPRDIPVVVVSSGKKVRKDRMWSDGQRALTGITDVLVGWEVVDGAGHEVWRDNEGRVVVEKKLAELLAYRG